jgi:glutamate/tyrosine decarboxylase-like PLP-dependent enzyme
VDKAAMVIGLGSDHLIKIPCDEWGRMDIIELEREIAASIDRGDVPFYVNATSGTTVLV